MPASEQASSTLFTASSGGKLNSKRVILCQWHPELETVDSRIQNSNIASSACSHIAQFIPNLMAAKLIDCSVANYQS
ncbi:hypothetical protein T4C_702 [Trichinella pseudospiralis]|uniref:Uncharacterized protein n=1 Tax=Trichinella pseudospiralis TaxID=6337 RepID=A0A0V1KDN3_TRIPS|nr:hypothetical protein T4C_702 [Trichinella pseudospiralis]